MEIICNNCNNYTQNAQQTREKCDCVNKLLISPAYALLRFIGEEQNCCAFKKLQSND